MQFLLITDIFGRTPAVSSLANELSDNTIIVDPYNTEEQNFVDEAQAYQTFMEKVGIETYAKQVSKVVAGLVVPTVIVAFSAGASALWSVSEGITNANVRLNILFYASQVRHFLAVKPAVESHMIYPSEETHFSIPELVTRLAFVPNVKLEVSQYQHGFMNKHSDNYSAEGYRMFVQRIDDLVSTHQWQSE